MLISRRADLLLASALACFLAPRVGGASPSDSDEDDDAPVVSAKAHRPARRPERHAKAIAFDPTWLQPFFRAPAPHKAAIDFQQDQWAAADAGFMKAAARMPAGSDERQAARFLAALAKANQAKWGDAAALFEALFRDYPRLAPYHAYNAARCRLREGKPQSALEWAGKVGIGSVPEAEAELVHLDALRALGRWHDAAKAAAEYLAHFPGGPRRPEALFKRAEALEKAAAETHALEIDADLADITALYRRVWSEAPLDDWGSRSAERLEAIAAALPPVEAGLVRRHLASEWFTRGMVYFDRNRNVDSEAAFTSALAAVGLDVDLECRVRYHRAQSVWKQRQRPRAAPLFDEADVACARAGNDDLHAKALYNGARSWATAGDRSAAQSRYERVESEHAEHTYADDARLRAAELATDGGDEDAANKILAEVPERYPKGDQLGEALWRLAFSAWRAENYPEAAAGWTKIYAASRTKRSGTRRAGRCTGKDEYSRSSRSPRRRAASMRAPSVSIRCRFMRCLPSPAWPKPRPRRGKLCCASCATPGRPRVFTSRRGRCSVIPDSDAPSISRAWDREETPAANLPTWVCRPPVKNIRVVRSTATTTTCCGWRPCFSIAEESGARRTRFPVTR